MVAPDWIWYTFTFAFGCCVGSFLNVVIYRLPRDKSLVRPPSSCPACGRGIRFYDNIPLISWIVLRARCRYCKAPISARYFIVELLTGVLFVGLFYLYFRAGIRAGVGSVFTGGWFVYVVHLVLLASLLAASVIDLQLWVIPLCICWFVTAVGLVGSAAGVWVINPAVVRGYDLLPSASAAGGALAAGGAIGLAISLILLKTGLIKRSYPEAESDKEPTAEPATEPTAEPTSEPAAGAATEPPAEPATEPAEAGADYSHRREVLKEVIFLGPVVICAAAAYALVRWVGPAGQWWLNFSQIPFVAGFLGSLWGYFIGCSVVWATRILGTLAFGREAMGLGDVHLMGAAGAVIGPLMVVIAFFLAPFFGLSWAGARMFFKKTRQIPYGPFLSLGVLTVMILHDRIIFYLSFGLYH